MTVDEWLSNAVSTQVPESCLLFAHRQFAPALTCRNLTHVPAMQLQLARRLPFCMATLLGTHNSAITLADGFGNRDEYFQEYFRWIKWVVSIQVSHALLHILLSSFGTAKHLLSCWMKTIPSISLCGICCGVCMQSGNSKLRTNDQYLSLTDQLNLGVRGIELDVHWVEVSFFCPLPPPAFMRHTHLHAVIYIHRRIMCP